jgi:predicted histidine transporter YuiF (NhaC family)
MSKEISKELVEYFLSHGPLSPSTILKIFTDLKFNKKFVQTCLHMGLDAGYWHLDENMHLKLGPYD